MAGFIFDNIKEPLNVSYVKDGETILFKTYMIDTGNEDIVKSLMDKRSEFLKLAEMKDDEMDFEKIKQIIKETIDSFFDDEFDKIYEVVAQKNIVYMMKFMYYFIEFVNEKTKI